MMILSKILRLFGLCLNLPKRDMGHKKKAIRVLLDHKYLSIYEIADRTGLTVEIVTKTLSDAFRRGAPIERVKRKVSTNSAKKRVSSTVWCYRKKDRLSKKEETTASLKKEVGDKNKLQNVLDL